MLQSFLKYLCIVLKRGYSLVSNLYQQLVLSKYNIPFRNLCLQYLQGLVFLDEGRYFFKYLNYPSDKSVL